MTSQLINDTKVAGGIDLFTAWVESQMAYSQLPGLSAAIVHYQELVWAKGVGYANFEWIAPAIVEAAAPREKEPMPYIDARLYVAKYRNDWEDLQLLFLNNELVVVNPALADPVSTMGKLVPVGEHTFRLRAKSGLDESGELAVFELDDEGRVIHLKVGENYTFPIATW